MDRNKIEDKASENLCNSSQTNKRLTPGKFAESSESEVNSINNQKSYEEPQGDTFFIYSSNMDTNCIWNSNSDYNRSGSIASNSLTNNQDSLNSIWSSKYNSNESLTKPEDHCPIPPISIDINEFELHENNLQSVFSDCSTELSNAKRDVKDNFSNEDRKRISTMINSHDGWGVKPINQNTPWLFPDGENDGESYPDTFSTWLNDSPNGAYAWETSKKLAGSDWSANSKMKSYGVNPAKQTVWSASGNGASIWTNSSVYNSCGVVASTKMVNANSNYGYSIPDNNPAMYMSNPARSDRPVRVTQEQVKNSCWSNGMATRQMNEFKTMTNNSVITDRFTNQRSKQNIDTEMQYYKHFKDTQKLILEHFQKDQLKIQEIDMNIDSLRKLPESQSRHLLNELMRQRQVTQQRMNALRPQHDAVQQKINILEEVLINYQRSNCRSTTPVDKQFTRPDIVAPNMPGLDLLANKLSSMQVQSTQDFRLDVPEFVPGKKWHGLSQNEKENRNPTTYNKLGTQYPDVCNDMNQEVTSYPLIWLFIQNLPSHVNTEMIQSFFLQSNNPCIMPIHSNPFSRWMLIRFPNQFCSQKALQLLSGKIGQTTLITDQDASIKLQELKGVMAKFVAHHN